MMIEEMESEIVRLRDDLAIADRTLVERTETARALTSRNVQLVERVRFIVHTLKGIRQQVQDILQDGSDE